MQTTALEQQQNNFKKNQIQKIKEVTGFNKREREKEHIQCMVIYVTSEWERGRAETLKSIVDKLCK